MKEKVYLDKEVLVGEIEALKGNYCEISMDTAALEWFEVILDKTNSKSKVIDISQAEKEKLDLYNQKEKEIQELKERLASIEKDNAELKSKIRKIDEIIKKKGKKE